MSVKCKAAKDDIGMETLVGDYLEVGINHGKKFFQRKKSTDDEDVAVFLYYWDNRDGADFSGWWFGDQVGGSQVWSRCEKPSNLPPKAGWRIPWDGPVQNDLVVEPPAAPKPPASTAGVPAKIEAKEELKEEAAAAAATSAAEQALIEELVQRATDRVVLSEIQATQALEDVHVMLEGDVSEEAIGVVDDLLKGQQAAIVEAHKVLANEIMEARKRTPKAVAALQKLTPRLRSVQSTLSQEEKQTKVLLNQKKQEALVHEEEEKKADEKRHAEMSDTKKLEKALPVVLDAVTQAEQALEETVVAAKLLSEDSADSMTEAVSAALRDTEMSATKAQAAITAARQHVAQQTTAARQYAPESRKVALSEYGTLMDKLSKAVKDLEPYLCARKDFEEKVEAKKVLNEVAGKMGSVEAEIEKATSAAASTESGNQTEEKVRAAEAALIPTLKRLSSAMKFIDHRLPNATGALKEDLLRMQERGQQSKKKLDAFHMKLRGHSEQVQLQVMMQRGLEKTERAEDLLKTMKAAEEPFLKGDSLLPGEKTDAAIQECESATEAAEAAANQARGYLKARLEDAKTTGPEASRKAAVDELVQLQARADAVVQRVATFKRETLARKTTILLHEATTKIVTAESKVEDASSAAAPLVDADNLDDISIERLKDATAKTLAAEKAAAIAMADAKKLLAIKLRQGAQMKEVPPTYPSEIQKLQNRLASAQSELGKRRKAAIQGERSWKGRQLVRDTEEALQRIDTEVERAEILTTPLGDERPSDESVAEMDSAVTNVQQALTASVRSLEAATGIVQGPIKVTVANLLERAKRFQERIDEMKAVTREQQERHQCQAMITEAKAKLLKVTEAFKSAAEAEAPYLKAGSPESVPLQESSLAVADSEAAAALVHKAITEARTFLSAKALELRKCVPEVTRFGMQAIHEMSVQNEASVQKLAKFKDDTEARKQVMLQQETAAKVTDAEEAVQKTILAATPLATQSIDDMSNEEASEICDRLGDAEREAQAKMELARSAVAARAREGKDGAHAAELTAFASRLDSAQADLAKAKITGSEHEQKFVARMLLQETREMVEGLDTEIAKIAEMAEPLTGDGGKAFVVASMTKSVLEALREYMQQKGITRDELFAQIGTSDGKVTQATFGTFLQRLPELISRPEMNYKEEERVAIFQDADVDKDGAITASQFVELLREKYVCSKPVAITDSFDLETGATIGKLEEDDIVMALNEPKAHDALGIVRVEVQLLKKEGAGAGLTGWVTMHGNQGTNFLTPYSAYGVFDKKLEGALAAARGSAVSAAAFVNQKCVDLRECVQGPLANAKVELLKLRPKVSAAQARLDQLRRRVGEGKKEHSRREDEERKNQEEKRERRAAGLVVAAVTEKVDAAQVALDALKEAAVPLTSLDEAALEAYAQPLSTRKAVVKASKAVDAAVGNARDGLANQENKTLRSIRGPWIEARQALGALRQRLDEIVKKGDEVVAHTQAACESLKATRLAQVSSAFRASIQSRGITTVELYAELAGKDGERILEDAFSKHVDKVANVGMPPEQKRLLLLQKLAGADEDVGDVPGELTRWGFLKMLQRYSKCVKDIAITAEFDIKSSNTLRKLELAEVVEVLEGPKVDDTLGVSRVRARAVVDDVVGWITVRGNQGTPFLQDMPKPYLYVTQGDVLVMQDCFASEGGKDMDVLRSNEVLEVLEGPRREEMGNAVRAYGKTTTDGATGWFTVASRQGEECAKPGQSTYTCRAAIALTSAQDIATCEVLRKLDRGELLTVLEGPLSDEASGVQRIKAKSGKDGAEGWVTLKGNAGTVYVEETGRQYVITTPGPMQKEFSPSDQVRVLAAGEVIDVLDGPKEEKLDPVIRLRARAASTGAVGWITLRPGTVKPWAPRYRCISALPLSDKLVLSEAKEVRQLEQGEILELTDGPRRQEGTTVPIDAPLRLKVRAAKDGAVGWVTPLGAEGQQLLECAAAGR